MKPFLCKAFTILTILVVAGYCTSCLTPYISPQYFWPLSFADLGFFFLACTFAIIIIVWMFINYKIALLLLGFFLLGYKNLLATFAFSFDSGTGKSYKGSTLKILTWNVKGFDNPATYLDGPHSIRRKMFNYIQQQNPDILCLQEFTEHNGPSMFSNTQELVKMGYKYYYRTDDISRRFPYGLIIVCSAIFSKIPIIEMGKTMLGDSSYPEHIGYADILFQEKPIRIFTTHFKSFNFNAKRLDPIDVVVYQYDSSFVYETTNFEKIKVFSQEHVVQSHICREQIAKSKHPAVFAGDLNAVPASYAYHYLSKGMQDAFLQKGKGCGATMDSLPANLRIDYFLLDKAFEIQRFFKDTIHLSDHLPQVIEISWSNKNKDR